VVKTTLGMLRPPRKISVDQWATRYRVMPSESSAEPGRYRSDRAPYQRGIQDAFSDRAVQTIVWISGAQNGKTTILENCIGYGIAENPGPMLMVMPNEALVKDFSIRKLAPMIRSTPVLRQLVYPAMSRDSTNTIYHKTFPGGIISLSSSQSPNDLKSKPIRYLFMDEADAYPADSGGEGDPCALAEKRTATFYDKKIVYTGTPLVKGASRLEREWERSDKRYFMVPCPHCEHEQRLVWGDGKQRGVYWDDADPEGSARYICEECGALWTDAERKVAIRRGHWVATAPFNGVAGFHSSTLYSPWAKLGELVREFRRAKDSPTLLKTFINTVLGEWWEPRMGGQASASDLMGRAEPYPAPLPDHVSLITAGIDVQKNRFEIEFVGWGRGEESWSLDYIVLDIDPQDPEAAKKLVSLLRSGWQRRDGERLVCQAAVIDTGYAAQSIYNIVRDSRHYGFDRLWAGKGKSEAIYTHIREPVWPSKPSTRTPNAPPIYRIGTQSAKSELAYRLANPNVGPGYCHFPDWYEPEYFMQLTSEVLKVYSKNGMEYEFWEKPTSATRNEALDCRIYAYAALQGLKALGVRPETEARKLPAIPGNAPAKIPFKGRNETVSAADQLKRELVAVRPQVKQRSRVRFTQGTQGKPR
jgi:phage terminase large subunit GpA-like protein